MRLLIFSDTHLTKDFRQKEFNFLKSIITDSDQVVINGDFWDGYIVNFDEFVKSEWSKLFPLLKKKKTTYLYGNHDKEDFLDQRVNLFSEAQQYSLSIKTKYKEIVVEHGNRFLHFIDERVKTSMIPKSFAQQALDFENFLVRGFGTSLIQKVYKIYNNRMKQNMLSKIKHNQVFICGHTHLAEIDLSRNFINSGMVGYGLGQYLLMENDEIEDREVWYDTPLIEEALDPALFFDQTEFIDAADLK